MKAYRKRFVQLNMLLIGAVLLLMAVGVAVYMYRDYYDGLRIAMEQVVRPLDLFSPSSKYNSPSQIHPHDDRREAEKDIMAVLYVPDAGAVLVLSQESLFDEETLVGILRSAVEREADFGTLWDYHAVYYRTGSGTPYRIALASTRYIGNSMLQLAVMLLAIWAAALLCFLAVSIRLSRIAVRPMEEAMAREKQFVADASHDLKTPLSVILANNSILRENPQATVGSLEKWVDSTQTAARQMQQLIGEMLTLADAERRDAPLALETVDASEVVLKAALQLESVAYEKQVVLETAVPEDITLRSNEAWLQRIAESLLENAIKYEPAGGQVWVSLTRQRHRVQLEVGNCHACIPAEDLPHVFDRFYRSDKSRQNPAGGHGLGLSIAREMVERLGGEITVTSSPEQGTVFTVRF